MSEQNSRSVNDYKEILHQAIAVKDNLSISAKQKVITFKNTLSEYIEAVKDYSENSNTEGNEDMVMDMESSSNRVTLLQQDLESMSKEIIAEIDLAKTTFG